VQGAGPQLTVRARAFLEQQRVGHLATANGQGLPHVVPVCYALADQRIYIALDTKPKRVAPERLQRVRNIQQNPRVALVIDLYDEDWSRLAYVLIQGQAELLDVDCLEHQQALRQLRLRYEQYCTMPLELHPVIAITPEHLVHWQATPEA
jgi:PPOX class probable F420-dependent enzyme